MQKIGVLTLFSTFLTFSWAHNVEPSRSRLAAPPKGGYRYHLILEDQKYNLTWTFDENSINFEVHVNATGWFGLGFTPLPPPDDCGNSSPRKGKGRHWEWGGGPKKPPITDLVYVWFDDTGNSKISDRRLSSKGKTTADTNQDYTLNKAEKIGNSISATFSRKRFTCDKDDVQFTDDFINLYWTYSDVTPKNESDFKMGQRNEGQKMTYLFSASKLRQFPPMLKYEITAPNVKLLNDYDTFFWCEIRKMPKGAAIDLIRFDPLLKPGNEGVVHHIYSYTCNNDSLAQYINKGAECFYDREKTKRHPIHTCDTHYISAHSISGDITYYPIPEEAKSDKYLRVEFHYFNPNLIQNITDNSTARYYFPDMNNFMDRHRRAASDKAFSSMNMPPFNGDSFFPNMGGGPPFPNMGWPPFPNMGGPQFPNMGGPPPVGSKLAQQQIVQACPSWRSN